MSFGNEVTNTRSSQDTYQVVAKNEVITVTDDRLEDIKTKLERYRREREELD